MRNVSLALTALLLAAGPAFAAGETAAAPKTAVPSATAPANNLQAPAKKEAKQMKKKRKHEASAHHVSHRKS